MKEAHYGMAFNQKSLERFKIVNMIWVASRNIFIFCLETPLLTWNVWDYKLF
jgi:hypothetical protein